MVLVMMLLAGTHTGGGDDVNCKWNGGKNVVMEMETPWHNKDMFVAELRHDNSWKYSYLKNRRAQK